MKILIRLIFGLLTSFSLFSCRQPDFTPSDSGNSIYYWRTTFTINDDERQFLDKHGINKLYLRFFDVAYPYEEIKGEDIIPDATIQFLDSVPAGLEIVPVVFITNDAMERMQSREPQYADKILKRVTAICRKNNIDFNEIQVDCDWTQSTRDNFYRLCAELKGKMDSDLSLSSTIRLHQLVQSPPPVDRGVLMVYNTGNLRDISTENSIFSIVDIEPYLRNDRLAKYQLPLDVAYPAYGWSVVFYPGYDGYRFNRIMHRTDFASYKDLNKISPNIYEANAPVAFSDDPGDGIPEGFRIRVELPAAKEILKVKKMIDSKLHDKPHNNILYHLDETQFRHYSDHEISEIFANN